MLLPFQHIGPPPLAGVFVPPVADSVGDYALAYDHTTKRMVYAISPAPHQFGLAWSSDGTAWSPLSSSTIRVGSATQPWRGVWDPVREAVVGWGWDNSGGPVGVVLGASLSVLSTDKLRRFDDGTAPTMTFSGDIPDAGDGWENLSGVFGPDHQRRVTVCLTRLGVWELDGLAWSKKAEADPRLIPDDVNGDTSFGMSAGAGAFFDAPHARVVFWFHSNDELRLVGWDGRTLSAIATTGLPDDLWETFGDQGFAIGEHPNHGIVVDAGGEHGLFGLGDDGFVSLSTRGRGPKGKATQLAYDVGRDVLVAGPSLLGAAPQAVFRTFGKGKWSADGVSTTRSLLADLSSGFIGYVVNDGATYAVSPYLRTARWTDETGWVEIVNTVDGDAARGAVRAQAIVNGFDGRVHAIMNDGSVFVLNDSAWQPVTSASDIAKDLSFPVAAFDPSRNVIVMWGSQKKDGGRKNDTFVFDGQTWRKGKKSVTADTNGNLCFDPAVGAVVRVGITEIAHFDGQTWTSQTLDEPLTDWFRCVWAHGGGIYVAEMGPKTVRVVHGKAVTTVGTFDAPVPRDRMMNLPFDRWWADDRGLSVHIDADDRQSFRLVLPGVGSR